MAPGDWNAFFGFGTNILVNLLVLTGLLAAAFALAGAVLTLFGFMHGEQIGLAQSPAVALSYLLVSGVLAGCALHARPVSKAFRIDEAPGAIAQPAE